MGNLEGRERVRKMLCRWWDEVSSDYYETGDRGLRMNRRKSIREEKPVPERSADSQIREIELKPISASLGDAAK